MKTYSLTKENQISTVYSLRNHRILVVSTIFLLGSPLIYNSDMPFALYMGTWLFYVVVSFLFVNPNQAMFKITSVRLVKNTLLITYANKQVTIQLDKLRFIAKKKYGLQVYSGLFATVWIPNGINNFDLFLDQLQASVPDKVFSQFRNPLMYVLLVAAILLGSTLAENLIVGLSAILGALVFVLFYE